GLSNITSQGRRRPRLSRRQPSPRSGDAGTTPAPSQSPPITHERDGSRSILSPPRQPRTIRKRLTVLVPWPSSHPSGSLAASRTPNQTVSVEISESTVCQVSACNLGP